MMKNHPQFYDNNTFRHFLSMEDISKSHLEKLLEQAEQFIKTKDSALQIKFHALESDSRMCLVFFEPSTRTRLSFELAAHYLHLPSFHLDIATSSTSKGETLLDTIQNLESMGVNLFVIRHYENGAAENIAAYVKKDTHIINAGDGTHQHPTQALLDMLAIKRFSKKPFAELTVTIMGDILHSRVARSDIMALKTLGVSNIRVVAPAALLPDDSASLGVQIFDNIHAGIENADVIIALRLQEERMQAALIKDKQAYHHQYGLKTADLSHANKNAIVLHPGPVNWGVELSEDLKDHPQSYVLKQVTLGVAARMSVIKTLTHHHPEPYLGA